MEGMFLCCQSLFTTNPTDWGATLPALGYINEWKVGKVTNMSRMFRGCGVLQVSIGNWDVSNVTNMAEMFRDCKIYSKDIGDISKWKVGNVTNMHRMFNDCVFNQDLSVWDVTRVTDAEGMFLGCNNIYTQHKPKFQPNVISTIGSLNSKGGRTARQRRQKTPGKRTTIRK